MSEISEIKPITLKCKICGGSLVNDYLKGVCACENCGNRWSLSDVIPNFKDYSGIIDKINRAEDLLSEKEDSAKAGQALIAFKSAKAQALKLNDAYASDLALICDKGVEEAKTVKAYAEGVTYLDKKNYRKALSEFEKTKGYKDTEILMERCREGAAIQKKKRIPYAVIVGMIIPAIAGIFLHEKLGVHIGICIPVFILGTALFGFLIWLEGVFSIITEILSFLLSVPLLIYSILAYGFHMEPGTAVKIALGVPVAIVAVIAVLAERKN